jgi:hypothetical protein
VKIVNIIVMSYMVVTVVTLKHELKNMSKVTCLDNIVPNNINMFVTYVTQSFHIHSTSKNIKILFIRYIKVNTVFSDLLQNIMDNTIDSIIRNPWCVENIMVFNFFCCPECEYQGKTAITFQSHATKLHPRVRTN